jgi:hypothetical protein
VKSVVNEFAQDAKISEPSDTNHTNKKRQGCEAEPHIDLVFAFIRVIRSIRRSFFNRLEREVSKISPLT